MKKIINYEKDIQFKTNIGEICSISLEHDFTVDDGVLKGDFIIDGVYKANELSINKDSFNYHLPLEYELEPTVDIETLYYDIDNFEYTTHGDVLTIIIDFGVRYEEKVIEPIIPAITESEINSSLNQDKEEIFFQDLELPKFMGDIDDENKSPIGDANRFEGLQDMIASDDESIEDKVIESVDKQLGSNRITEEEQQIVISSATEEDEYITYHVHVVCEGETFESIAQKYATSTDVIKIYNNVDVLETKSKLIIPIVNE